MLAVDLFCGGGGTSTGFAQSMEAQGREYSLLGINHWQTACDTFDTNHAHGSSVCAPLSSVDPIHFSPAVSEGVDLLLASPECTHHSSARGGLPVDDQSRASAWHVLQWCEKARPTCVLVENVPDFQSWGPLTPAGRPSKTRRGETFRQYLAAIKSLGYDVAHRIIEAADCGDATSRRRLFIQARRDGKPIRWPRRRATTRRRGFSTVLNYKLPMQPWEERTRPLVRRTMERIYLGMRHNAGMFVLPQHSGGAARSVLEPLPTLAAACAVMLVDPNRKATRMLSPEECAAAMSFPKDYTFCGSQRDVFRQIGNAVPVRTARALVDCLTKE